MPSNDITFCNNPRCTLECTRRLDESLLRRGTKISVAAFGPVNGDEVTKPDDCEMYRGNNEKK